MDQSRILNRAFKVSLGGHVALILFLLLKGALFPESPVAHLPSLRVDLVALPDLKKSETPAPLPTPAVIPVQEKKEEAPKVAPTLAPAPKPILIEKADSEKGDFQVSKKKIKKKENSKKEKDAQKKLKAALDRIKAIERIKALTSGEEIKGNQVSKGSALSGEAKVALETSYFDVILERVRTYWELPKWLQEKNLSAKVMLHLDAQGALKAFEFVQASGNPQFDSEVRRTLQAAAPFPVPPTGIAMDVSKEGILLGFPL